MIDYSLDCKWEELDSETQCLSFLLSFSFTGLIKLANRFLKLWTEIEAAVTDCTLEIRKQGSFFLRIP